MKATTIAVLLMIILSACAPAVTLAPTATLVPPTAAPTNAPEPTDTPTPPTPAIQTLSDELDTMFQNVANAGAFSGSVLVAQNSQVIISNGYGFANHETKIPNTPQTKFRIASITKQFTAMAIMMLQEQDKLNVQDKICTYLTDCPEIWKPITIHQLLTHTSGIPDTLLPSYQVQEVTSSLPLDKMIAEVKTKPLDFQPGELFSYDDTGYILLGKIIEAVSGQSYEAFLQQNIFDPLQMSDTGYEHNPDDLAVGYDAWGGVADPINMWVMFSAGALYSTVEDLYRYDQALYTDKLVPQRVLDTMFTAHVLMPDDSGWSYGYGWFIPPDNSQRFVVHYGGINGFTSMIKRYPDDKATIIILTNQEGISPDSIGSLIEKKLFGK